MWASTRAIVLGDPHRRVHVKAGVRPGEHLRRLVLVEQLQADKEPERRPAERLGQPRGVVHRPRHEGPIRPEPAIGDQQVQMRMPVGARAMGLPAGDDPHREITLARQRPDRGGDGPDPSPGRRRR